MSGAIMEKVWGMLGLPEREEEETEELDYDKNLDIEDQEEEEEEDRRFFGKRSSKVVNMPQTQQVKMVICQPTTFEQSESICNLLKEKKSIIVNLEYVNKDIARRIVDVVSGAVHALDGNLQKVSNSIFLVAPYNYDITNEMAREEIKNKLSVSWLRNNSNN
jgi:cell division inhibitor SepF